MKNALKRGAAKEKKGIREMKATNNNNDFSITQQFNLNIYNHIIKNKCTRSVRTLWES